MYLKMHVSTDYILAQVLSQFTKYDKSKGSTKRGLYELIGWQYIWTLEMGRSMWYGFKRAKNCGSDMFVA